MKSKRKKIRRVVLGVGHPWFYDHLRQLMLRSADDNTALPVILNVKDLGGYNKIRLVAEVIS